MPVPNATYIPNAKFLLEIDGISIGSFEKATLGDSEWAIISGRTGDYALHKVTSSGLKTVTTLTLEKHLRDGGRDEVNEMLEWHKGGSKNRKSGSLVIADREDVEQIRYNFNDGWVSKITPPPMDASQDNSPLVFIFEISLGTYSVA